jgi:hypothetical protein
MTRIACAILTLLLLPGTSPAGPPAQAGAPAPAGTPGYFGGTLTDDSSLLLNFTRNPGAQNETEKMVESQSRLLDTGVRTQVGLTESLMIGHARAEMMIRALRDEQFQKAIGNVTEKGKRLLEENQGLRSPAMVIGGVVSMWVGTTIQFFKGEQVRVYTRIEGRNRLGEFHFDSPILNSKISVSADSGVNLNLNRSIASIGSKAEINFSGRTQSISTQLRHPLSEHLDLSIGATQIPELNNRADGQAKIEYRLNF